MAAEVSFAGAGELLGELAGVRSGAKQVERAAEALGREGPPARLPCVSGTAAVYSGSRWFA